MGFESLSMENAETSSAEAGCVNKKVPGAKKRSAGGRLTGFLNAWNVTRKSGQSAPARRDETNKQLRKTPRP